MLGKNHATIRRLRSLRRDGALRKTEGVFVAEGLTLAREAADSGAAIESVFFAPELLARPEGRQLLQRLDRSSPECLEVSKKVLDSCQDARSPQPVLLVVRRPARDDDEWTSRKAGAPLVVAAVGVQDPGNLGSMVRTADAAGADAFFACGDTADPYHPRAVRATMGSVFRLPPRSADAGPLIERLRRGGISCLATDASGGRAHHEYDLTGPTALFFGREAAGLPDEVASRLDDRLRIPMRDGIDSLSVGAAAAVVLFEASRQRTRGEDS